MNKIHNTEKLIAESIKIGNVLQQQKQEGLETKRVETVKGIVFSKLRARKEDINKGKHC
ncbi:hypothetical protein FLA4_05980 [Candidatus Rickettsia kotlanii]|nr:hypothetical protein FLA4_05980 [Candidatus Rickettsia kotlanii]BDU61431.1 hypothetical protein HM2_05990 [Candidatus Rickettsia kotlanii]